MLISSRPTLLEYDRAVYVQIDVLVTVKQYRLVFDKAKINFYIKHESPLLNLVILIE